MRIAGVCGEKKNMSDLRERVSGLRERVSGLREREWYWKELFGRYGCTYLL